MRTSEATDKIDPAMVAAQGEMPVIPKDSKNPHFRNEYASLLATVKAIRPVLLAHGMYCKMSSAPCEAVPSLILMRLRVTHSSGQWFEIDFPCQPRDFGPQGVASTTTYARRYTLKNAFNLVDEVDPSDDDGNAGQGLASDRKAEKPTFKNTEEEKRRLAFQALQVWWSDHGDDAKKIRVQIERFAPEGVTFKRMQEMRIHSKTMTELLQNLKEERYAESH